MEILMQNCQIAIGDLPQIPGGKVMRFQDPSGIIVSVPLTAEGAHEIARGLGGISILPIHRLPPHVNGG